MAATGIPPDQRPVSVSIALIGINGCNDAVDLDDDPVRVSIALIGINGCNANLRGADLEGAFQSP